ATDRRLRPFSQRLGSRMTDRDDADDLAVAGDPEQLTQPVVLVTDEPEQAGPEALVDRGEQEEHDRLAGVNPPPWNAPLDLLAGQLQLVGLGVAIVVVALAHRNDDVHRRARDPGLTARR